MTTTEIRSQLEAARAALAAAQPFDNGDNAICRVNGSLLRSLGRQTDAALARYTAAQREVEGLEHKLILAEARERETARVRLALEDVKGARVVRDRFGWHKVVRVSAKSVTVETGYSWTDRIAIDKILEVAA